MKVIRGNGAIKRPLSNAVVAIGVFDGLHLGHQFLIKRALLEARRIKKRCVVITFFPHPIRVLLPKAHLPYLMSLADRVKLVAKLGVDICWVIPFSKAFSRMSAKDFVRKFLVKSFQPKVVYVGRNFKFGRNRQGGTQLLRALGRQYGFRLFDIPPVTKKGVVVSSTLIRKFVESGEVKKARNYFGRYFSVNGKVVRGDGRGKTLGFPTANIKPEADVILPKGVYLVKVRMRKKWFAGMANIGYRPSFTKKSILHFEVHILRFTGNLYHKNLEVQFLSKLRNEKKFSSPQRLISQLKRDKAKAFRLIPHIPLNPQ